MNSVIVFILSVLATQLPNGQAQNWQQPQQNFQNQHGSQNVNNQNRPQLGGPNFNPISQENNVIVSRFNYFDLELLKSFNENGNYFISPASIKITLAMLLEGSFGKCAQEISKSLHIPIDVNASRITLSNLLNNLSENSRNTILTAANLLAVSNKYNVLPEYSRTLTQNYNAEIKSLDFDKPADAARFINNWADSSTNGLIKEIINADSLNNAASLIIANALFFKAQWKIEFDQKRTKLESFQTSTVAYQVQMMKVTSQFRYRFDGQLLHAQILELPYSDDNHAMLIILPSETSTVDDLQGDLQHTTFAAIVDELETTEVNVNLPKFDIEYSTNLGPTLQTMGIKEIFSERANLTGIVAQGEVKVSKILHKAKVEVNEKGTTAAAVTGAVVIPLMGSTTERFTANRPFLFFIYNINSKNIIFEGRLNNPPKGYDVIMEPKKFQSNSIVRNPTSRPENSFNKQPANQQGPYFNTPTHISSSRPSVYSDGSIGNTRQTVSRSHTESRNDYSTSYP